MYESYNLYVRHELYHTLKDASRHNRDRILAFIESLPSDPFQSGDYTEEDPSGRSCQVKVVGKYALYFWADHPAKEMKIVDLIDADLK